MSDRDGRPDTRGAQGPQDARGVRPAQVAPDARDPGAGAALDGLRVGFIGFGMMGSAIARGLSRAGMGPDRLLACARDRERLGRACAEAGATPCRDAAQVVEGSDVVVVAVKPTDVAGALAPVSRLLGDRAVLSVAWGVWFDQLKDMLPAGARHISAVPNIPVGVRQGVWVAQDTDSLDAPRRAQVEAVMQATGQVARVPARLMGVAGTVAGCAPAYLAVFLEAMADAGVKNGLPRAQAYGLAQQMVRGTCALLQDTGQLPAQLKDAVCSPGGATIRGIAALEEHGLRSAVIRAVDAALS